MWTEKSFFKRIKDGLLLCISKNEITKTVVHPEIVF